MSAIFGILRFDGAAASGRDLERMGNALAPRGPDARRFVAQGPAGLGHCLLRVNREDMFDRQPVRDVEADLTLVADCRLDNREELAAALGVSPQQLRDIPDSAIILRAYKKWGENCAEHLLGDFTFAVWDGRTKKFVLARDHMGQLALLYHRGKDFFAFSSNQVGLLALPDVPHRISTGQIVARLFGAVVNVGTAGDTTFEDVRGLPGGSVLSVGLDGRFETRRYWEPRPDPRHLNRDEAYYVAAYRSVLLEAVNCRVRRTLHPPALLLSGGYDSAAIAGLAGPVLTDSGRKLIAVASVMPEDDSTPNARPWVKMCARDMPHLDVHYYTRDDLDLLRDFDRANLETGVPVSINGLLLGKMTAVAERAGARLVMNGSGGDYTLNPRGGRSLVHLVKAGRLNRLIGELRAHRRATGQSWRTTLLTEVVAPLLPSLANAWWRMRRGRRHTEPVTAVNQAWADELHKAGAINPFQPVPRGDARTQLISTQRKIMDSPSHVSEIVSLRGVQTTAPFHDKRIVELALAIPQDLYVKSGRTRYLATAALKDVYPPEFQTRSRRNDVRFPDFQQRIESAEPQLLAELARMERAEHLRRYIDFGRIRKLLAARNSDDRGTNWEHREAVVALRAFTIARYLEWFARRNR